MSTTELADRNDRVPGPAGQSIDMHAGAALAHWLEEHPAVGRELEEAGQARIHLQELDGRAKAAETIAIAAERRAATEAIKLDPAGHRVLSPTAGGALVAGLVILDVWPLNWAAQAFGLNSAGSWLVTGILLVASVAAMVAIEASRDHPRRRAVLAAVITVACAALVALRTKFLMVVATQTLTSALLQSVMLTAISAGLILSGSMVLSRTRLPRLARALAAARRCRREADAKGAARDLAAERMQRHFGALRQMLIPWALNSPHPAGVDSVSWAAALERAARGLFSGL